MSDYTFNAEAPPEILGPRLLQLNPGREAEVRSPEGTVTLFRDETKTDLVSFKIINYGGPYQIPCFDYLLEACKIVARDHWADCIEYRENSWGIRWIFFYPKGS
jgi:hypothetical protein